jgi:hypothetical protein
MSMRPLSAALARPFTAQAPVSARQGELQSFNFRTIRVRRKRYVKVLD